MGAAHVGIDGENLRYSLDELLDEFHRQNHYLPYADWGNMFQAIEKLASKEMGQELNIMRAYWYVIDDVQYNSYFESKQFCHSRNEEKLKYFKQYAPSIAKGLSEKTQQNIFEEKIKECSNLLEKNAKKVVAEAKRWKHVESIIQRKTDKLQFQRFGYLKVTLDNGKGKYGFTGEKGTDIKLATDLMAFKDIYDVAIIVSGDGDYIPVVVAIKNMGKQVIVVDFKTKNGTFLPGGSKKLKENCDFNFSLNHSTMYKICRYGLHKKDPPAKLNL